MPELSDNTNWSETDASNNQASPNGWPEGMMPSGVNDSARANMGALKRFWNRANPVQQITNSGAAWQFTTGNAAFPTAYINGEVYSFVPMAGAVGNDTFQVNALGAKPIYKRVSNTVPGGPWVPLAAADFRSHLPVQLVYDSTLNAGAGGFALTNPWMPVLNYSSGGTQVPGTVYSGGGLSSAGSLPGFAFDARDDGTQHWLWYATAGSTRLNLNGTDIWTISSAGGVTTGPVQSNGSNAALGFQARDNSAQNFLWYGQGNEARLYMNQDLMQVDTSGNLHVVGSYVYFGGGAGAVNTTGGPLYFANAANHVLKQGSGNGSWLFQNYAGTNVANLDSSGNLSLNGGATVGTITIGGMTLSNDGASALYTSWHLRSGSQLQSDGGLLVAGNATIGGLIQVGGLTLENSGSWLYTPNNGFWSANWVRADGGGDSALYAPNGGITVAGNVIANNAVYIGGSGGVHWYDSSGYMRCDSALIAGGILPNGDNSVSCGLSGQAWAQVASYWFNQVSARALKRDIRPLADDEALDRVMSLRPVGFRWKKGDEKRHAGFIADEVARVMGADFGGYDKTPEGVEGIAYNELTAVLWRAVQSLALRIEQLEAQ